MANWRSYIDPSTTAGQNTLDGIIANGPTYGIAISDDLSVTGLSTFSDIARFSSTIRLDGQLRDGDNAFGTSGQVLSSDGTDTKWINAAQLSAGAASQVAVNDDSNTNAERFITIVDSSSGNNNIKTDGSLKYNPSTNTITTVNITGNVTGNVTGNLTGNVTGDVSGNSGTATALQTARNIGGVSFDGSASINLPGVNQSGNQDTSGNAATATKLATARNIGGVSFDGSAAINLPGVNQSGNQDTSGNAATATVLATTRAFSISGEVTANSVNFNGSSGVTLNATVNDNVIDYDNLKASNRTSATNGQYLRKRSGNTGGMTWEDIPVVTGSNLSGNTLSSGIVNSSLTSLGTLSSLSVSGDITAGSSVSVNSNVTVGGNITISGNASITGTTNIDNTITLDSKNEDPEYNKGVIIIQPSASGGKTGINFRSKVNSTSDHGYLWWYDDNNNYRINNSSENGSLVLGVQNDHSGATSSDSVAIESSGDIFLNPGLNDNSYGGASGPNFGRGKVYVGRASTRYQVWHEGNDGPSSGLNADKLDDQEGSYYRNAGNLNDGIIPDARISGNFLKTNADDSMSGLLTLNKNANRVIVLDRNISSPSNYFNDLQMEVRATSGTAGIGLHRSGFSHVGIYHDSSGSVKFNMNNGTTTLNGTTGTVWGSGNDGSGSGLDADLLDGFQRVDVMNFNNLSNKPSTFSRTIVRAYGSNATYTPTSGTKSIQVYCIAGGGGGGNATGDDSGEQSDFGAASGGGGGGCAIGHYQLTGSFSASIQIGGGGGGSSGGGESRFTPSGSYTGNGTIQGNGGGGAGQNSSNGAGGGGASGGFNLTGHQGNNKSRSSSGGQYFHTPGNGGVAGFVFGTFGSGGNGAGPTGGSQGGQSGSSGVVVVYEYIS